MSIKPGQSGYVTINPAIGGTSSDTLNPLSPVEYGKTVSGGIADDWTAGTSPGGPESLSIALSSSDFTDGSALPVESGANAEGEFPVNPALAWSLSGDDSANVASYQLRVTDTDAGNYVHWSVDDIATNVTSIAVATDAVASNWGGSPTINVTGGGQGAALGNGWEPVNPPAGETHNYRFQIQGVDSEGSVLVTSNILTGTYTGTN